MTKTLDSSQSVNFHLIGLRLRKSRVFGVSETIWWSLWRFWTLHRRRRVPNNLRLSLKYYFAYFALTKLA